MKNINEKTKIYLQVLIALLIILVGTATYAFFAGNNDIDAKANLSAEAGGTYTFTSTTATDFSIDLSTADMQQSQSGNFVNSTLGTIDVNLTSPEGMHTSCTFDLLFTWTSSDKYTTSDVVLPYIHSNGTTYNYEFSTIVKENNETVFEERDLSKVNRGSGFTGNSGTIAEDLFVEVEGDTISKTFSIEARIYNLPVNQPNLLGKNMKASIKVANVNCEYENDSSGEVVNPTGLGTIYAMMASAATNDSSIDFGTAPTTATSGVFKRNTTASDPYPVYYYRGIVDNNNVLFDGFCWKIVRTTETAGIKMIYNGVAAADGSCNNTGTASQLSAGGTKFNNSSNSPADVGYMFGTRYEYTSKSMTSQSGTYVYANDVSYSNGVYTLIDTKESTSWTADRGSLISKYHYTCFASGNTCEGQVYYIYYFGGTSSAYYLTLNGEKNIDEVKEKMFKNDNDSLIKTVIDDWYEANLKDQESKLEDAIWCNNRSITRGPLASKDTGSATASFFETFDRVNASPSFTCDKNDAFTQKESAIGNGALDNPVGLLTASEYTLAGSGWNGYSSSSYLNINQSQWSLSPCHFDGTYASEIGLSVVGKLLNINVNSASGVRPSVSLKPGTKVTGDGNGSVGSPYVVE